MKLRVKYKVTEEGRFLGHLDLTRTIMKILRRADLPVMLSEGFNPHPRLSFAMPLSVGHIGDGEFFEVALKEEITEEKFLDVFNKFAPQAIEAIEVREVKGSQKSMSSIINSAIYVLNFTDADCALLRKRAADILTEKEIIILKTSKKKTKEADIRPFIYDIIVDEEKDMGCKVKVYIAHGSKENLKVQELLNLFSLEGISIEKVSIKRKGLYIKKDNEYLDLIDVLTNVG